MTNKQYSYLLFILSLSTFSSFIIYRLITFKNEMIPNHLTLSEYLNYYYLNGQFNFNYVNGLWLLPIGSMFFCLIGLFDIPEKQEEIKLLFLIWYYKKRIKRNIRVNNIF